MTELKRIVLVGGSGRIGTHILKALLDADFAVTVLTRNKTCSTYLYDKKVKVIEIDYNSPASLDAAFDHQDAVVSAVGPKAISKQTLLIDAAAKAGVQRFIPSDFGPVSINLLLHRYPVDGTAARIQRYLVEKSSVSDMSWTILSTGGLLEVMLAEVGMLDFRHHHVELFDEGESRMNSTSLVGIGQAIVGILRCPAETRNRVVKVSQVVLTQNQLLAMATRLQPDVAWEVTPMDTSEMLREVTSSFRAGDVSFASVAKLIKANVFAGDKLGAMFQVTDNEMLGVEELAEGVVEEIIKERLAMM